MTPEECYERRAENIQLNGKINVIDKRCDAIAERLEEVLEEVKAIKDWFVKFGSLAFLLAVLGDKAIPLLSKLFGV